MNISRPEPGEYHPYQLDYISLVPPGADLLAMLAGQSAALRGLTEPLSDARATARPQPKEWSVKEVLGHINDTERIFAYRVLRLGRGDATPLPGFEQDDYAATAGSNARTVADLLDEFDAIRAATLTLVRSLPEASHTNIAVVSGVPVSVRSWLHIIPGHVEYHLISFKTSYGL